MIIERKNQKLVEVAYGIWFDPALNDWDSTYFGKFYDKIQVLGYSEKEEKKSLEVNIDETNIDNDGLPIVNKKISDVRMVFKNHESNSVVMLSNNSISINKLAPYNGWEHLVGGIANPLIDIYKEIGLGKGLMQVNALYLNKFIIPVEEKLSSYFNFMPVFDEIEEGIEESFIFQSEYNIDPNIQLVLRLNGGVNNEKRIKEVYFELACMVKNDGEKTIEELSEIAHQKARNSFVQLTKLD